MPPLPDAPDPRPLAAPRVFIATPTADGVTLAGFTEALAGMIARLERSGVATAYHTHDGYDLILARNLLADAFLRSDCSHLLFVDSDMAFPSDLALRLLAHDRRLVGAVYPKRQLDWDKLARLAAAHGFDDGLALAQSWNVQLLPHGATVRSGFAEVGALPGGFLLIARACFDAMAAGMEVPEVTIGRQTIRAFFREIVEGATVTDLDYSFCRHWRACGGTVWAYVDADILHIGDDRTGPPFGARIAAAR